MLRAAISALVAVTAVAAQDPPAAKPPDATKGGAVPAAFRSFLVWDKRYPDTDVRNRTNKPHCLVCEYGLNPVAVVFAPKVPTDPADPVVSLLKDLDQATLDRQEASFGATVAFLVLPDELRFDAARDKLVDEAKAMADQAKLRAVPVGLSAKKSKATAAWKLDGDNAEAVTVIVYDKLRVIDRWTFPDGKPTDADRKAILDAIDKAVPVKK